MNQKSRVLIALVAISSSISAYSQEAFSKIEIHKEGIYKIDQTWLDHHGLNLDGIDPRTIRMFNNGGRELPQNINTPRPVGLIENAIWVSGEDDGRFDSEDFILFYGRSVHGYEFDPQRRTYGYHLHHYTNTNVYWLALGGGTQGKRMPLVDGEPIQSDAIKPASFRDWNAQIDGAGFDYPVYVGGLDQARVDTTAPAIAISIIEGQAGADTVLPNFVLQISLADSSGISLFASEAKGIFLAFDGQNEII